MLGIGNGSSRLGIGNVGVQTNFARTPPFPLPSLGTSLELNHSQLQVSVLGSNSSISNSKYRNLARTLPFPIPSLFHSRFQASNFARTLQFPIPSVRTWLELLFGVRAKFRRLESGMEEFEPGSNPLNRKWRSSSQEPNSIPASKPTHPSLTN